jgi:DNA modification methylase
MRQIVINADNIKALKEYPDNYFDAVVTDPPYGLGKEPDAAELMKDWVEKGYHEITGTGFMGKDWDAFVPQPNFWKEVFRVLKHGGHVVSFFGTRTYDWGVMAMRFAGFEVRDCIQWIYGSGFPKSHNISKAIDKVYGAEREVVGILPKGYAPLKNGHTEKGGGGGFIGDERSPQLKITNSATEEAKQWDGWGSALKPSNEPIVLARKPLEKGLSIAENVLKWGTGGINIDGCRIGFNEYDKGDYISKRLGYKDGFQHKQLNGKDESSVLGKLDYNEGKETKIFNNQGRFPANLILTHHPECECKGLKKVKPSNGSGKASENGGGFSKGMFGDGSSDNIGGGFTDENGEETIEDWDCHEDCPIRIMDEQSGISKTGDIKPHQEKGTDTIYGNGKGFFSSTVYREVSFKGDVGGASRFFYCAKASKSERNQGLEGFEEKRPDNRTTRDMGVFDEKGVGKQSNFHPTVKPVKLMQYLVKLITPPNGKVLDPFCGSGTTGIACKLEGFEFVGLEQDTEYSKIAQSRIDNYQEEIEEIVYVTNKEGEKVQITQTSLF